MTRNEQAIEQVASIICENGLSREDAEAINNGDGFTFDVRWQDQEYITDRDYTRVEGMRLDRPSMDAALETARHWGEDF
jgi:hypothetical protein